MSQADETTETPLVPDDPLVGQLVDGKYQVLGRLAAGGMALIYRAEQQPIGRMVALKALAPNSDAEEAKLFKDRFFVEASTCAKLKHPNTVTLFDYGYHAPTKHYFMVMELVEGRTLSEILRADGPLHPIRALTFAIEVCRSLQEAHQHGIVHRDLKPSNVMITQTLEGEAVKVLDFGIAKVLQSNSQSITMEDRIVGSPRYMSPEQISQGKVDGRTDIYALGVMLFELISGRAPYAGQTAIQTLMKHVNDPVPRLSTHTPGTIKIHPALDELVLRCMAKESKSRYGSVDQLKQALRQVVSDVAESTEDFQMSTESVVRHALARQPDIPEVVHSQPTMERPVTEDSTFTQAAPVVIGLGGITLAGLGGLTLLVGVVLVGLALFAPRPGAAPTPEPIPLAATDTWTFTLLSEPAGARVIEGDRVLGTTPLAIQTDPDQVGERRYEVQMDGYQSQLVKQSALAADTEERVELEPFPSLGNPKPVKPKPRPTKVKPRAAPRAPELDVIEQR